MLPLLERNHFFWFCALSGSGLFLIQMAISFLGIDHHETDGDAPGHEAFDAQKFKWLSKQGLIGFLMMFGWSAITCKEEFHLATAPTILLSLFMGALTIFITAILLKSTQKLQSAGSIFRIEDALGKEAIVYQRIPKNGTGKISLSLNNFTYELNAVSDQAEELSSFTRVHVLRKIDETTVSVVLISEVEPCHF